MKIHFVRYIFRSFGFACIIAIQMERILFSSAVTLLHLYRNSYVRD